jgi:hypothetical protein
MMKWIGRLVGAVILVLIGWWLWDRVFVTDETRVRRQIAAMQKCVEQGNLVRLADAISPDYNDDRGLDKGVLLAAVRSYRAQYDTLFIHLSDVQVTVEPDRHRARAVLIAKVLAKPRSGLETELFSDRFRLFFRQTDKGWKLIRVESPELKFD